MAKAVLVMDMPECCGDCSLQAEYDTLKCAVNNEVVTMGARSDWCPLKPMPEKSEVEDLPFRDRYKLGWNACIDKIMGGE